MISRSWARFGEFDLNGFNPTGKGHPLFPRNGMEDGNDKGRVNILPTLPDSVSDSIVELTIV